MAKFERVKDKSETEPVKGKSGYSHSVEFYDMLAEERYKEFLEENARAKAEGRLPKFYTGRWH
jgi:hypothetical protein